MDLYSRMAGVNVCIARAAGVDFDKAAAIAGETVAQLIQDRHGRVIGVVSPEPLGLEELRRGTFNAAVIAAVEICPNQVPAAVLKDVQAALTRAEPTPAPAPARPAPRTTAPAAPAAAPRAPGARQPAPARPATRTAAPAAPAAAPPAAPTAAPSAAPAPTPASGPATSSPTSSPATPAR